MLNKKAEMGIGTLILFIAMILVAAVAAGVLIQTASSLQSRALLTGSRTTTEVATALQITYISGKSANATHHTLDRTYTNVKLVPGSDPIRYEDLVVSVDTSAERESYVYDSAVNCSDIATFTNVTNAGKYGVRALTGGALANFLTRGDIVEICFFNPEPLAQGMNLRIIMTPKAGQQATVQLRAPDVMIQDTVPLYP